MSNILEIKPIIRDLIVENIDDSFEVYWTGERYNVPTTSFCLLTVIGENKDKRTSTKEGGLGINPLSNSGDYGMYREMITTLYKTATITIGIYVEAIGDNYDIMKEFAYEQINLIERLFERKSNQTLFYPTFSVQNVGDIRPLHETVSGGYQYRFEFDLTIGYDEPSIEEIPIGEAVIVDINKTYDHNSDGADNTIYFEVDSLTETTSGRIINKP